MMRKIFLIIECVIISEMETGSYLEF
jgi:hypothetical protein